LGVADARGKKESRPGLSRQETAKGGADFLQMIATNMNDRSLSSMEPGKGVLEERQANLKAWLCLPITTKGPPELLHNMAL
jgi:hypothetical protein